MCGEARLSSGRRLPPLPQHVRAFEPLHSDERRYFGRRAGARLGTCLCWFEPFPAVGRPPLYFMPLCGLRRAMFHGVWDTTPAMCRVTLRRGFLLLETIASG